MAVIKKMNCHYHGQTDFVLRNDGRFVCKKCVSENVTRRRKRLKEELVQYKGGKCEICGYDKCIDALEFHHLNPKEKDLKLSGNIVSIERAKLEADKCILVCANCHREIHARERADKYCNGEENRLNTKNNRSKIKNIDKEFVLSLINEGKKQKEISIILNISVSTLKRFLSLYKIKMKNNER